jgi:hypothetical protein
VYGCANDFMKIDRTDVINTRGCRNVMYSWYRSGFAQNIVMAIIGLGIGALEFYAYSLNRHEYYKLLDELDDMRKPMMNATMSMSTINSKGSTGFAGLTQGTGHIINFGPNASVRYNPASQRLINHSNTPSMGGESVSQLPQIVETPNQNNFVNPLQAIQNANGRFAFRGGSGRNSNNPNLNSNQPYDRFQIDENDQQ